MPLFSIIAVTTSEGAEEGELDGLVADFDDASEAKGYARRQAEDTLALAAQLALDFDYSHVSVFAGDVPPEAADTDNDALVGLWLFQPDGVDWTTPADLRATTEPGAEAAA